MKKIFTTCVSICLAWTVHAQFNPQKEIDYCATQALKTLKTLPSNTQGNNIPRSIDKDKTTWRLVNYKDWCSGFWSGALWYLYEGTKNPAFKVQAERFDKQLKPLSQEKAYDHDLGFQIFCSYGNGYRLTNNPAYKKIILATADTLATLYNPKVGTILSWPREVKKFGAHNTIIDNMINLELLFWAAKNGKHKNLYKIAEQHALTTMKNHFRDDYTSYHVVLYDTLTGQKIKGMTHQGYADNTMWARGQSWAIYGFTMCYRFTKNPQFLDFAQKVTNVYLKNLPDDSLIPYWDFNTPEIPNTTRDASAAAVTASALFELADYVKSPSKKALYLAKAKKMVERLSSPEYQSRKVNDAFLLHSTGNRPINGEVDASIIYGDYYYIEALLKYQKLLKKN